MSRTQFIITLIGAIISGRVSSQDTLEYGQANAALFSNNYTLIKTNKTDKNGKFIQTTATDDGQFWIGRGTFKEKNRKIILTFDTTELTPKIEFTTIESDKELLTIKWFDLWGEPQDFFSVKYTDTTNYKDTYQSNLIKGFLEIPFTELKDDGLSLYFSNGNRKILDFQVIDGLNQINIFANDTIRIHIHRKSNEKLKKRKNGFKTIGMWTKGRKTLFVRQEE
jgi:hypothetical protein